MTSTEQFIASLVRSLAWPAAVFGAAVLFRQQLADLFSKSLRRLKAGPVEFEFERVISEVEANLGREPTPAQGTTFTAYRFALLDDLAPVARASPSAAVLEAHARLEQALQDLTEDVRKADRPMGAVQLARLALAHNLITAEAESAIVGVTTLRNITAHDRRADISAERAMDYLALVDGVLYAIQQGRKREQ